MLTKRATARSLSQDIVLYLVRCARTVVLCIHFINYFYFPLVLILFAHIRNPGLQAGKDGIEAAYVVVIIIWFQYISKSFFSQNSEFHNL